MSGHTGVVYRTVNMQGGIDGKVLWILFLLLCLDRAKFNVMYMYASSILRPVIRMQGMCINYPQ